MEYIDSNIYCEFQPTLPARGATGKLMTMDAPAPISTHAPRTGSDLTETIKAEYNPIISTHAPRTGSDQVGR